MAILYYIHDPMCSWCWAFRPRWDGLVAALPEAITPQKVLGGLAPDSDQAMPEDMRHTLEQTWHRIRKRVPDCAFNFDFWRKAKPRRSTWPACRAVLAAQDQGAGDAMILAIQQAYYLHARNPSDRSVLIALAAELGLDQAAFSAVLDSAENHQALADQRSLSQGLGVSSYPSLLLDVNGSRWPISVNYNSVDEMLEQIAFIEEMSE